LKSLKLVWVDETIGVLENGFQQIFLRNLRLNLMDYWVFNTFVFEIEQFIGLMISNTCLGNVVSN
jgi:hypothetical protein